MQSKQIKLKEITSELESSYDCLICCASFEKRCLSLAKHYKGTISEAYIFRNKRLAEKNEYCLQELQGIYDGSNQEVPYSVDKPISFLDKMHEILHIEFAKESKKILFDITTFTRESLLIIIALLKNKKANFDKIHFVYSEAEKYGDWLSKGIRTTRSVLGYPGNFKPSKPSHLVVLAGYEHERAVELVDKYEPKIVSIGMARKNQSITQEMFLKNKKAIEKINSKLTNMGFTPEEFKFSAISPIQTKKDIAKHIKQFPEYNTIISGLNTKVSMIGIGLAALANEDIQLCYAPAKSHNYSDYSTPGEYCRFIDIKELL